MKKEEKRRKFHDSLLQMLYPPTSPPPPPQEHHHQTPIINISLESFPSDATDGDDDNDDDILSSDDDKHGQHKLTRAQRKRLRKKKLRQSESQRRPIIGPLLPTCDVDNLAPISDAEQQPVTTNDPQLVRHIAAEESTDSCGASSSQNKIKQRRMAKKLVRDLKEQKDSSH